jgi:hypothetical protein
MQDTIHNSDSAPAEQKRPLITFIIGAVVLLAIAVSAWFLFHEPSPPGEESAKATVAIKMNSAEQEYIASIRVMDLALSRAENFLHQEVTILDGTVLNTGSQTVTGMQITVQFSDQLGQIALRETRSVLGHPVVPLAPGQQRNFEISFDHVPASWNMQQPAIQVAGLSLQQRK